LQGDPRCNRCEVGVGFRERIIWSSLVDQIYTRWLGSARLPPDAGPSVLAASDDGLAIPLTPVQEIILRLVGVSHRCDIPVFDEDLAIELRAILGGYSDPQRLWLPPGADIDFNGGNLRAVFEEPVTLLLLVAGRRSGKTTIASVLMSWLVHRVLKDNSFLDSVPILPDSIVSFLNLACDTSQARILFRMLSDNLGKLDLTGGAKVTSEEISIGRVLIESLSSSARSSRGRTACGVCLDEFAHFQRTSGPLADRNVWKALAPSIMTFGKKGLIVVATSPAGRSGTVWELFEQRGTRPGMLTVQAPTWVMNPLVPKSALDGEFGRDENLARQEYGAEFIAPHGRFLNPADVRNCLTASIPAGNRHAKRHMHVDIGLKHDATAIAYGYLDRGNEQDEDSWKVVIERVEIMEKSGGSAVSVWELEKKITAIAVEKGIRDITFDQYQSAYIVERLMQAGYNASVFHATQKSNQDVFGFLRDLVVSGKIVLPDDERLARELEDLECSMTNNGFKVEAMPGCMDDCADAVAVCAWHLASANDSGWKDFLNIIEEG